MIKIINGLLPIIRNSTSIKFFYSIQFEQISKLNSSWNKESKKYYVPAATNQSKLSMTLNELSNHINLFSKNFSTSVSTKTEKIILLNHVLKTFTETPLIHQHFNLISRFTQQSSFEEFMAKQSEFLQQKEFQQDPEYFYNIIEFTQAVFATDIFGPLSELFLKLLEKGRLLPNLFLDLSEMIQLHIIILFHSSYYEDFEEHKYIEQSLKLTQNSSSILIQTLRKFLQCQQYTLKEEEISALKKINNAYSQTLLYFGTKNISLDQFKDCDIHNIFLLKGIENLKSNGCQVLPAFFLQQIKRNIATMPTKYFAHLVTLLHQFIVSLEMKELCQVIFKERILLPNQNQQSYLKFMNRLLSLFTRQNCFGTEIFGFYIECLKLSFDYSSSNQIQNWSVLSTVSVVTSEISRQLSINSTKFQEELLAIQSQSLWPSFIIRLQDFLERLMQSEIDPSTNFYFVLHLLQSLQQEPSDKFLIWYLRNLKQVDLSKIKLHSLIRVLIDSKQIWNSPHIIEIVDLSKQILEKINSPKDRILLFLQNMSIAKLLRTSTFVTDRKQFYTLLNNLLQILANDLHQSEISNDILKQYYYIIQTSHLIITSNKNIFSFTNSKQDKIIAFPIPQKPIVEQVFKELNLIKSDRFSMEQAVFLPVIFLSSKQRLFLKEKQINLYLNRLFCILDVILQEENHAQLSTFLNDYFNQLYLQKDPNLYSYWASILRSGKEIRNFIKQSNNEKLLGLLNQNIHNEDTDYIRNVLQDKKYKNIMPINSEQIQLQDVINLNSKGQIFQSDEKKVFKRELTEKLSQVSLDQVNPSQAYELLMGWKLTDFQPHDLGRLFSMVQKNLTNYDLHHLSKLAQKLYRFGYLNGTMLYKFAMNISQQIFVGLNRMNGQEFEDLLKLIDLMTKVENDLITDFCEALQSQEQSQLEVERRLYILAQLYSNSSDNNSFIANEFLVIESLVNEYKITNALWIYESLNPKSTSINVEVFFQWVGTSVQLIDANLSLLQKEEQIQKLFDSILTKKNAFEILMKSGRYFRNCDLSKLQTQSITMMGQLPILGAGTIQVEKLVQILNFLNLFQKKDVALIQKLRVLFLTCNILESHLSLHSLIMFCEVLETVFSKNQRVRAKFEQLVMRCMRNYNQVERNMLFKYLIEKELLSIMFISEFEKYFLF